MTSTRELSQTVAEQRAELERLRAEVAAWRARYERGEKRELAFGNSGGGGGAALHASRRGGRPGERPRGSGDRSRSRAASIPPGIAAGCGRCGSSRASAAPKTPTRASSFCSSKGRRGCPPRSTFPTLMGYDSDHARSLGEVGKTGVAISSLADMEVLFDGIPLDQVSTSMTINGPAIILWAFYIAAAEKQGVSSRQTARHDPERHPQGVHGAARLVLSHRAGAAAHRRLLRVGRRARAAMEYRSRSRATTSARRAPRQPRSWHSRWPTASPTWSVAWPAGSDVDDFAPPAVVLLGHP